MAQEQALAKGIYSEECAQSCTQGLVSSSFLVPQCRKGSGCLLVWYPEN